MKPLRRWLRSESCTNLPPLRGGLALSRNKPGLPLAGEIATLPLPEQLVLPLLSYRRETLTPLVSVGQQVSEGQELAEGLVASASGCIIAIESRPILHPSGRSELCVVIRPDHDAEIAAAIHPSQSVLTLGRLAKCAVSGLGGAGFGTSEKLASIQTEIEPLDTLIINAVECEPLISCDEALMMCDAPAIIRAIGALITMTGCRRCVLAIENDKLAAIAAMQSALADHPIAIELLLLPPVYPSGAERSLIHRVTGQLLTAGERPTDRGMLCINVATALASWKAQSGFALTSRIVTLAGEACNTPVNVRVTFGTSVADVLRLSGNEPVPGTARVRVGGPLSGFDLAALDVPVTATTNCIGLHTMAIAVSESPCIRCGACSDACPEQLLPQQLFRYARADNLAETQRFGLDSCIECGCCDIVCPSAIPLTAIFRHARDAHREQLRQDAAAAAAEQRYLARERRLVQRAAARDERRQSVRAQLTVGSDPIADALLRARRRRKPSNDESASSDDTANPDSST